MRKFEVVFEDHPQRNRSFTVRGICCYDVLNPCWDNRPTDIPGEHWSGLGEACAACTAAARASKKSAA